MENSASDHLKEALVQSRGQHVYRWPLHHAASTFIYGLHEGYTSQTSKDQQLNWSHEHHHPPACVEMEVDGGHGAPPLPQAQGGRYG